MNLTVEQTFHGNWEARVYGEPNFAVMGSTPGAAVNGLMAILEAWDAEDEEEDDDEDT